MPLDVPVIQPPAIYRSAPLRGRVMERVLPAPDVARLCNEQATAHGAAIPAAGKQFLGCSVLSGGTCIVIRIDREDVRVHEVEGHCRGWPADHPGGPLVPSGGPLVPPRLSPKVRPSDDWAFDGPVPGQAPGQAPGLAKLAPPPMPAPKQPIAKQPIDDWTFNSDGSWTMPKAGPPP
jgi:hypothetical protein